MAILFVASEAFELKPLGQRLTGCRPLKWPLDYAEEGVWEGRRFLLAANGAGPKLASRCVEVALRATSMAELSSSKLEAVVSTGICGALEAAVQERDILIASKVLAADDGKEFECRPVNCSASYTQGIIVSTNHVAGDATEKKKLAATGAVGVEMESAGVAERTATAGLPFCCIKVVTDILDEEFIMDFNKMRTTDGRFSRGKIVSYAFTHPGVMPRLFQLKRRSEDAADALGAFLASCRFQFSEPPAGEQQQ
jgi:purine-nucleoside phosphorylase